MYDQDGAWNATMVVASTVATVASVAWTSPVVLLLLSETKCQAECRHSSEVQSLESVLGIQLLTSNNHYTITSLLVSNLLSCSFCAPLLEVRPSLYMSVGLSRDATREAAPGSSGAAAAVVVVVVVVLVVASPMVVALN